MTSEYEPAPIITCSAVIRQKHLVICGYMLGNTRLGNEKYINEPHDWPEAPTLQKQKHRIKMYFVETYDSVRLNCFAILRPGQIEPCHPALSVNRLD